MKLVRIISSVLVAALVVTLVLLFLRRDHRIEPFVDLRFVRVRIQDAAVDREVVKAELAEYGTELVPALRAELHKGTWRRNKLWLWAVRYSPQFMHSRNVQMDWDQDARAGWSALTLGRLGNHATSTIPDLQALANSGRRAANLAQVALAMIQSNDATVQSNAIAALTGSSQSRRDEFAWYANELWPKRPEVLDGPLRDTDATVRSRALSALCSYGTIASNAAPVLLEMLSDPSPIVRPPAALALGLVAPEHGATAVAVMLDQLRTNFAWTGADAHILFQALGPVATAAVPTLEAELVDPKMAMFHGDAAGALWRITGRATPQVITGLSTGVRIGVQYTQLRCLRILREIGPPAAAVPILNSYTNHPRILIRKLAHEALDSIRATSAK